MDPCNEQTQMAGRFTPKQGQYLAFIHQYTVIHGQAPAEANMQGYFRTSPPAVHQMVLGLHKRGLITRTPGQARSIVLRVPVDELPPLHAIGESLAVEAVAGSKAQRTSYSLARENAPGEALKRRCRLVRLHRSERGL